MGSSKLHYICPPRNQPVEQTTVVVADTDDAVREPLVRRLTQEGYRVIEAATPMVFLDELSNLFVDGRWCEAPPIIVAEVRMPGISCLEGISAGSVLNHALILLGDDRSIDLAQRAGRLGACAVMVKPFAVEEVITLCDKLANRGSSIRRAAGGAH